MARVDLIGGTVKHSVWRFVRAGADVLLDAKSYAKIAEQRNPIIDISFITADEIQAKAIEITEQWKSPNRYFVSDHMAAKN